MGKTSEGIDIFKIDLSLDPKERFKETTQYFKNDIGVLFKLYEEFISKAITYMFRIIDMVAFDSSDDKYQEWMGIAEVLETSTHKVMMMNYLYELDAYCTSIVARLSNGTIILGRNLDFYFPKESRKINYIARFYQGENFIFEGPMFAGFTGMFTALKPKKFAISIDERTFKNDSTVFF